MDDVAVARFIPPPRIVKPRTRQYRRLPVVAIHGTATLDEHGEYGDLADLVAGLPQREPTLFVKYMSADWVAGLDAHFAPEHPAWQWHASTRERTIVRPDGIKVASRVTTAIHFFGFKHGNYHKIIDPVTMTGRSLSDLLPPGRWQNRDTIIRLLKWAVAIRDFCAENGLEVRPSTGGISAQLLTDGRFYPNARRKVPRATNDSVRERMPGNFYHLSVTPGPHKEYTAHYIDQHRAHHHHARTIPLPDADTLYAHGRFQDMDSIPFREPWAGFHGLYCVDLLAPNETPIAAIRNSLRHMISDKVITKRFVYSNELDFLRDMGYTILGVRAAWGSRNRDEGLPRYAEWAMAQLDHYNNAPWLKPLLLATYGTLATRPKVAEAMFQHAKTGKPSSLQVGANVLRGVQVKGRVKLEPRIANVLHRGMIEAATRVESLSYAHYLTMQGYHVLCIYADAVIVRVDEDKGPPLIVDPWRLKETLNHLQFINTQSFQSGEMTRMPGVPGISRAAAKHRQRSPGHAPRVIERLEAGTGRLIRVDTTTNQAVGSIHNGNV